ncbi:MAG: DISARM system helicase DrmA [Planctomycetota bacterium]
MSRVGETPRREDFSALDVRKRLVEALELDLVGPWPDHDLEQERLPGWERPSSWYLTGFLIPTGTPEEHRADDDEQDDIVDAEPRGMPEENADDVKPAKKGFFPSSMGLSFLVSAETRALSVEVTWGDYHHGEIVDNGEKRPIWERQPRRERLEIILDGDAEGPEVFGVPNSGGLELQVAERTIVAEELTGFLPEGTRSVSVFLVNRRKPPEDRIDSAFVFQPRIEVRSETPFVARPDLKGAQAHEWDEQVADLHYCDVPELATGHGVSVDWEVFDKDCRVLWTAWIPRAEVEKTDTAKIERVVLAMDELGSLADGEAARSALQPLVEQYRSWIEEQGQASVSFGNQRSETAKQLLKAAENAADRIERGIDILGEDAAALDAFRVANRAVSRALKKRLEIDSPGWRAFQLAFILLNLPGMADPSDSNRKTVDLLFFPTGGGKTEAYLGLAAFAMVLRRLRNPGPTGAGVSVIMRYTLRLLTLDQLGRAAGLVCALELEREEDQDKYGKWPFEIGLWVGKAATPNLLGHKGDKRSDTARTKVRQFKNDPRGKPSPIPLENCPWCNERFEAESFHLLPNDDRPKELRIVCANFECEFSGDRPLPIQAVDEPIYRRLPAFLIATVDKFASLPWVGASGALLGGADRYDSQGFYGAVESGGKRLDQALPPPDLIIQDELHLISGPLGTMAGLYETAIEALCVRQVDGQEVRPKIVASTATVRKAEDQIQALFGRDSTQIFPPPGPSRRDSFFAQTRPSREKPARQYVGVAAQGKNPKVALRRTWLALMGAAQKAFLEAGAEKNEHNPADPYMTVLGYFNSLRELGGSRRILEEEVQNTISGYGARKRIGEERGLFRDRKYLANVVELTSRVSTDKVAEARRRLECGFHENEHVDCAIATNMISVGLDIPRLGLMVVMGQPKTHSEYIQATSRVGRDDQRPGLVVTLLNIHKPRDRSHYERFRHYHETFYRSVEVSSVTPFSARALDRGLAGAMVAFARHIQPELTPADAVENLAKVKTELQEKILSAFIERLESQPLDDEEDRQQRIRSVRDRVVDLLDAWKSLVESNGEVGVHMKYQKYEGKGDRPLLRGILETSFDSALEAKFRANRSLRDVEPEVSLIMRDPYERKEDD